MHILSLNGAWEFRQLPGGAWQPAQVPGSVHLDLLRLKQIPNPFYGDQEKQVMWVAETDWEYTRNFVLPQELLLEDRVYLEADGLDTLAEVSLNEHPIGTTDNMFRSFRWEVKHLLAPGENRISIRFRSPVRYITEKYMGRPLTCGMESIPGGTYLRKAACHFGWDWGPKLPSIGIWRDIRIIGQHNACFEDIHLRQRHSDGQVRIEAGLSVEKWQTSPVTVRLQITAPDQTVMRCAIEMDGGQADLACELPNPQLWWPNGYGEQALYRVDCLLLSGTELLDRRTYTLGLRTIELRREPDEWGESFTFVVNGVPIFAKGANWIPPDAFPNRITGASLEQLIASTAAVHMNMLRVWGGGAYESEQFYDLCDRSGILVWQDFMFACGIYPLDDPSFRENLRAETQEVVRRLRHHACLALWCGNNEMEVGWVDWGWSQPANRRLKAEYQHYFYRELPAWVASADPDTAYWPGSPSSGVAFKVPNGQERGDAHYWDVWHGRKPFSAYLNQFPRFMSEFGFQSLPPLATIATFAEPQDWNLTSYIMEHHQRSGVGNELILSQMAAHFRIPKDFANLTYLSMLLQAEGIRFGVEHWRRNMRRVSGALYWQLDDNWPVISWSSIDYYGRWKALHYAAKHFFAPVLLSAERTGRLIRLFVSSDRRQEQTGNLTWALQTLDGQRIRAGEAQVAIPSLGSARLAELDFGESLAGQNLQQVIFFAELAVEGEATSRQFVSFTPDKHLRLADPCPEFQVEPDGDGIKIRVKVRSLARFVELQLGRADVVFSDNYFTLQAGASREIACPLPPGWTVAQAQAELQIRSLFDSY